MPADASDVVIRSPSDGSRSNDTEREDEDDGETHDGEERFAVVVPAEHEASEEAHDHHLEEQDPV